MWFEDEGFWRDYFPVLFPEESFDAAPDNLDRALSLTGVHNGHALDLCCGPGRYAVPLARKGFQVTAVDRSAFLLNEARNRAAAAGVDIAFVEHDMRSFVRPSSFDVVLSLGNSFGYFDDRDDDLRVLTAIHNNLKPGGRLIIDITCKEREARTSRDYVSELPDGSVCVRRNRPTDDWTRQQHEWLLIRDRTVQRFQFSVQLYAGSELQQMLRNAGFEAIHLYGDFDGRPFAGNVNRLIAIARKPK
jgi:SAM-dependent methyltransferase